MAVFCAGVKGAFALDDAYVGARSRTGWASSEGAAEQPSGLAFYENAKAFRASRSSRNLVATAQEPGADIP